MLNSISWQEFLFAILILLGGYYIITSLLLYQSEIIGFLKRNKIQDGYQPSDHETPVESDDLMGSVRYERANSNTPRINNLNAEEVVVTQSDEPEEVIVPSREELDEKILKHSIEVLQEEIKTLAQIVGGNNKSDGIHLFQTLLSNYPHLAGTPAQQQITSCILGALKEHSEWQSTTEEINSWWPGTNMHSNN